MMTRSACLSALLVVMGFCGVGVDVSVERHDEVLAPLLSGARFICDGRSCLHRARERLDVQYVFASVDPPRLHRVVLIERALTAPARAEARAWVDTQVARLAGGECKESWP